MSILLEGAKNELSHYINKYKSELNIKYTDQINLSITSDEILISWACTKYESQLKEQCKIKRLYRAHQLLNCIENPIILNNIHKFSITLYDLDILNTSKFKKIKTNIILSCNLC